MMKYILVLILFGFSSVSFAHDEQNEEEKWISCLTYGVGLYKKVVCTEINIDNVNRIEYDSYSIRYFADDGKRILSCDRDEIQTGRRCSDIDLEELEPISEPTDGPTD